MARLKVSPLRLAVYKLLVDGLGPNSGLAPLNVAQQLKISKQAEAYHREALEAAGYIRRIPGTRNPVLYKRGPHSNVIDEAGTPLNAPSQNFDGGTVAVKNAILTRPVPLSRSSETYVPTSRAHVNGRFVFSVLKVGDLGPMVIKQDGTKAKVRVFEEEPYNDKNGVRMLKGKLPFNGSFVSVEFLESSNVRQLNVWPSQEELVPQQFEEAKEIFQARAQQAVNLLAKHGGWQFGLIEFIGKIEFASTEERILANIPEDMRGSHDSPLWVDTSLGPREIETTDPEAARAVFDFPGTVKEIRKDIAEVKAVSSRINQVEAKAGRLIDISEKLEKAVENITAAEATLIERNARDLANKIEHDPGVMFG